MNRISCDYLKVPADIDQFINLMSFSTKCDTVTAIYIPNAVVIKEIYNIVTLRYFSDFAAIIGKNIINLINLIEIFNFYEREYELSNNTNEADETTDIIIKNILMLPKLKMLTYGVFEIEYARYITSTIAKDILKYKISPYDPNGKYAYFVKLY